MGAEAGGDANGRQSTPDILRDNNTKRPQAELEQEKAEEAPKVEEEGKEKAEEKQEDLPVKEASPMPVPVSKEATPEVAVIASSKEGSQEAEELPNNEEVREKKIITSEEEAKVSFSNYVLCCKISLCSSLSGEDCREAAGDEGAEGERGRGREAQAGGGEKAGGGAEEEGGGRDETGSLKNSFPSPKLHCHFSDGTFG